MKIKLTDIAPDPNQPRKTFKEGTLQELKSSYNSLGLIQPITVRPHNGKYMIIVGERRFRASKQRGDEDIECIVRGDVDDKVAREMQFAENSQQENISPLELGKAFLEHRRRWGINQEELARVVGLAQRTVANYEGLLAAAANVQSYVQSGELDASTAYEISTIKDTEKQSEVAQVVVDRGYSRSVVRTLLPLVKTQPHVPVEHLAIQAQYGIELQKTNGQAILNELKRQELTSVPASAPDGQYRAIIIDPPWPIEKLVRDVRPNQFDIDYPTMTLEEIEALPIPELACEDGCHIYLWTTHKHLPDALDLLSAWDANYQCLLTWVKNVGMTPFSWMYSTEHCLFARIGSLPLLKLGKRLDFQAKVREHSRKPDEFYDLVKEVSPEPRIDYFSREPRDGFTQYGNETTKFIEAVV